VPAFRQQGAVGGQIDFEAVLPAVPEDFRQFRVQQRFAQDMQGQVVGEFLELGQKNGTAASTQVGRVPAARCAEGAGQVAAIGDFEKDFLESGQGVASPRWTGRLASPQPAGRER
jgi:hypothetical protein